MRQAVLVAALAAGALFVPRAGRAADAGDGRRHAQRASHLAAGGKCRQAIAEFDKAIAVLHDPTLLFNRGECHRKLGNAEAALEDYNQFLAELPNAPNRAQVEARITELRQGASVGAAPVPPPAAPAVDVRPAGPGAPAAATTKPESAPVHAVQPPGPRAPTESAPVAEVDVAAVAPPPASSAMLLSASADAPAGEAAAHSGDAVTSRPWFWVALGAVVVGAGVGAYFVLGRDPTNVPRSDLGNYRF